MPVVVVGLHERDAPLEVLESVAFPDEELPKALAGLGDGPHLSETVILSTCMRTEVYAVAERFHDGVADICRFFGERLGAAAAAALAEALVVEHDESAVRHLFAVASGIDSPVLGEGEILRQVPRGARACPTRADLGSRARRPVPPRRRGRKARPGRDGDRPGHHLARPRRGGARHRAFRRFAWRTAGRRRRCRRDGRGPRRRAGTSRRPGRLGRREPQPCQGGRLGGRGRRTRRRARRS